MKLLAAALAVAAMLGAGTAASAATASPAPAAATPAPGPSAQPTASPSALPSSSPPRARQTAPAPTPPPTANPAVVAGLRSRIGDDLANGLAAQQQVADALAVTAAQQQALATQVTEAQDRIDKLQAEIARLDTDIQDTQGRVTVEQTEVAALVRALARRPDSVVLAFARSRSLGEALANGTELLVAGRRANALQRKLEAELAKLNQKRNQRQADVDRETALQSSLRGQLDQLQDLVFRQQDMSAVLRDLLGQFQDALGSLQAQPPDVTSRLLDLLEQQQRTLNMASMTQAWSTARVGAGRVQLLGQLPKGAPSARMVLPIPGAVLTQPFGPTDLWFEPPLGQYPHFHAGIDLAAPAGAPVVAAADGVVTAVGSTAGGYGNYVVIAHAGGILTLYGHLRIFTVREGEQVRSGEVIGAEGSTGYSTGPHLHFEVRYQDSVVDPAVYVGLPPVA